MLALLDGNYTYLSANPAYLKVIDKTYDQIIGNTVSELFGEEFFNKIIKPHADRCLKGEEINYQEWFNFPTLGKVYMDINYYPYIDANKKIKGFVVSARNITKRKFAQDKLIQSKIEAEKANRAKSEFLSNMSHELRTPLNAVIGFSEVLLKNKKDPLNEDQTKDVTLIHDAGKHLLNLINEILDLSKIESGQEIVSLKPINLFEVISEILGLVRPIADKNEITLENKIIDNQLMVQTDRFRLKQILINFITNGIKYNKPKGLVQLSYEELSNEKLKVKITDTGMGIPQEFLNKLFIPFERIGKDQTDIPGTGIGLALSMKLAKLINAKIEVESKLNEGSCFSLELPTCSKEKT